MAAATSFASLQMDWDAPDPITAFARFKQKCQLMFSSALKDTNDEEKVSYILLWSGEKGLDIFNSWTFTKEEDKKKHLNKAIKREHHPIPILDQITPKLTGAKLFSKLNARNGYWNVKLDEESSYLTTFNTPFGRYRFLRMPFGLRMSQDIFQFKIDEHPFQFLQYVSGVKLHNHTARAVVNEMKILFAENGIPRCLQCDNGTQFTSGEFQQLASQFGFEIVTSSPHYPRGHGFVERQVQTIKKTILKCRETKEDIDLALLALRTTPLSSNIPSLAELRNGRIFKSTLPGKIQPSKNQEEVRNWLKVRQDNQSYYYNSHTKELPKLLRDQAICAQDPLRNTWNPARVVEEGDSTRSHNVETGTGAHLRRNRIHQTTLPTTSQIICRIWFLKEE